jgi:hypothetical protein
MSKRIILPIALAGMSALALSLSAPAAAKPMTQCQVRHSFCSQNCIMDNLDNGKIRACLSRTCDHQFKACAAASGESSDPKHDSVGQTRPEGKFGRGGRTRRIAAPQPQMPERPPLAGILSADPGITTQGPAGAGVPIGPAAAPAAPPPVIIR